MILYLKNCVFDVTLGKFLGCLVFVWGIKANLGRALGVKIRADHLDQEQERVLSLKI